MITRNDYITSSGKYPERLKSPELTPEVLANIDILLIDVNAACEELGIIDPEVASGFRPSDVNSAIGGAKSSGHTKGTAIDLKDKDGSIDFKFRMNPAVLRKRNLMLENPMFTPNWCHLDKVPRVDRANRMFNP